MTTTKTKKPTLTVLEYVIQGSYGFGWEDVSTYNPCDYEKPYQSAKADLKEYNASGTGSHRIITRRSLREDYKLNVLESLPTISQGQTDDLKIQTKRYRVWLSRMTKEDGMPYDNQVTIENLNSSYNWVIISQFQAK